VPPSHRRSRGLRRHLQVTTTAVAALSLASAPALADTGWAGGVVTGFDLHAEGTAVHLFGDRSTPFGWGAALLVAPELKLGRIIGLEVPLGMVGVSESSHPSPATMGSSVGSAYFAMPGARFWPFAGRFAGWGDAPWIAGGGGLADTGGILCPAVDVRAGADLHLGSVAFGPLLGFVQIIDVRSSAMRNDARLMMFGVHGQLSPRPLPARPASPPEGDHPSEPDAVEVCKSALQEDGRCPDESPPAPPAPPAFPAPPAPPAQPAPPVEEDRFELDDRIYFEANSATISRAGTLALQAVAALLKQHREYARLWILGHADEHGDDAFDMHLSEERAMAVRAALLRLGVEETRMETRSFGKNRPRQLEHTLEANAENRRVELQIVLRREVAPPAVESAKVENERGRP
jgi:outer membrane protein OmpA-like peptidoglycan-associated protein